MKSIDETLAQVKTWAVLEGDAEAVVPYLPKALRFLAIAQGASWNDALSLVERLTKPGELVVDRDGVETLAVSCIRLGRRVLCICKPGPEAERLKAVLATATAALAAEVAKR